MRCPRPTDRLTATDLEAWLDGFMPYALEQTDIAGSVVVVVKDGQVLLQKGYGYSDLAKRTPVDPERTLFRPGSVSKLFTWTAVMQLVEQGKLDLDEDVNKYIDFKIPPYQGKPITLRNIMTHTAGMEEVIRGLIANDEKEIAAARRDAQALGARTRSTRRAPRRRTPTTPPRSPATSSQRVSGQPFDEYIEQHIFAPLGMQHSSFRQPLPKNLLAMMSKGYKTASDGKEQAVREHQPRAGRQPGVDRRGHGQVHDRAPATTARSATSASCAKRPRAQMHGTGQTSVGPLNRMMLGFYETTVNGHRAIAHGGDTQWFHSDLQLFLDDNIGIYVSINSSGKDGSARLIRDGLFTGFVNRYLPGPERQGATASTKRPPSSTRS